MEGSYQSIGVLCTVYDRLGQIDSYPRIYESEAAAMRDFRLHVNMPSPEMVFHTPGDFELVLIARIVRDEANYVSVSSLMPREILLTGSSAVDQDLRERYIQLSVLTNKAQEKVNASEQVGLSA